VDICHLRGCIGWPCRLPHLAGLRAKARLQSAGLPAKPAWRRRSWADYLARAYSRFASQKRSKLAPLPLLNREAFSGFPNMVFLLFAGMAACRLRNCWLNTPVSTCCVAAEIFTSDYLFTKVACARHYFHFGVFYNRVRVTSTHQFKV
jgi:hypothetical protein